MREGDAGLQAGTARGHGQADALVGVKDIRTVVASISDPVPISIRLIGIGHARTVIDCVRNPVTVQIRATRS